MTTEIPTVRSNCADHEHEIERRVHMEELVHSITEIIPSMQKIVWTMVGFNALISAGLGMCFYYAASINTEAIVRSHLVIGMIQTRMVEGNEFQNTIIRKVEQMAAEHKYMIQRVQDIKEIECLEGEDEDI